MVCDLWQSWANAALNAVIFCRPSYVTSHWSGSTSPKSKSRSTNALSNSFSRISSQRNDRVAAAMFLLSLISAVYYRSVIRGIDDCDKSGIIRVLMDDLLALIVDTPPPQPVTTFVACCHDWPPVPSHQCSTSIISHSCPIKGCTLLTPHWPQWKVGANNRGQ